ncbi:WD-40 repeat-containing protein, partial [Reticulomyxa filosa]
IQIQNKNNEINILDKQIIDKDKLIQQMERDFNDKQKKLQSQYEQSIALLEDKNLQLTQDFQTLSKKPSDQDKEEKDEQKQPKNQDDSSSVMSSGTNHIPNFDSFCSSSKLLKTFTGHTDIVWSIDYSTFDDGQFICSGSSDKTVRVWDVDNNKQIQSFNEHSSC